MIPKRVESLRNLMKQEQVQAVLVPSTDAHASEYVPECWKRRQWISGCTGSAGDVVVTTTKGGLWTDGRYYLQAEEQLKGSGIDLFRVGMPDVPKLEDWIADELEGGGYLGIDPKLVSIDRAGAIEKALKAKSVDIKYISGNLVDEIWKDQPDPSLDPVLVLEQEYTGRSVSDKLNVIREKLKEKDCGVHILAALDTIAWTFNLRGTDIDFNPLFISYAIITLNEAHLFVDLRKITDEVRDGLGEDVVLHEYKEIEDFVRGLGVSNILEGHIWIDPGTTNQWIMLLLGTNVKVHKERSPVTDLKSVKNDVELEGIREAHAQDGVAMVRFLKWLEEEVQSGTSKVTELSAAAKLEEFRRKGKNLVGLSFTTISGYADHGAIIHYGPTEETDAVLKPEGIYLVDSGGQYRNGTTDITRTVTLGPPTDEQREMFTRVLKGHIGLAMLKFPKGWCGRQVEFPARKALWDVGRNYNHGTGHGIGHYLNVHEGPMSISPRDVGIPLRVGNVISNEPGYYKAGEYGIRIENVVVVRKIEAGELNAPNEDEDAPEMLGFETITLCPIDLSLVEKEFMTGEEIQWLNDYHAQVLDVLAPHLDEEHVKWLREKTKAI